MVRPGPVRIYADHAATSPMRTQAAEAVGSACLLPGNASSVHAEGRQARAALEQARGRIAACLGVAPADLILTSGATEANNAVIGQFEGLVLASAVEHPSILAQPNVRTVPVDSAGLIDLDALWQSLADTGARLVATMAVNNETGVVQPLAEIAAIVHEAGALLHVDAVQAVHRAALPSFKADFRVISAHKLGGPKGSGAILLGEDAPWQALIRGGGQELGRRCGTENVAGAMGFAAALEAVPEDEQARIADLRQHFENALRAALPNCAVIGEAARRAAHISAVAFPGRPAQLLLMQLDLAGVAASAGAACSSGKVQRSHVLTAMGLPPEHADSCLRFSFGWNTTAEEVDELVMRLSRA